MMQCEQLHQELDPVADVTSKPHTKQRRKKAHRDFAVERFVCQEKEMAQKKKTLLQRMNERTNEGEEKNF
jgi:hypothetical protein